MAKAQQEKAILLVREGLFWRAYEQGAFALCKYVHPFKVTSRFYKGLGQWLCYVGFPDTALQKWTSKRTVTKQSDKLLRLQLTEAEQKDVIASFSEWKEQQVGATRANEPQHNTYASAGHSVSQPMRRQLSVEQEVMLRLRTFPLERSSPLDCMNFVAELKSLLQD